MLDLLTGEEMETINMQTMQTVSDDEAFDVPIMNQAPILGAGQYNIPVAEFLETISPLDASMAISPNEFNELEGEEVPPLVGGIWPPALVHETQAPGQLSIELLAVLSEFHTLLLGGGEFHSHKSENMQSSNHKYPRYLRAILLKGGFPTRASLFAPGAVQIAEAACREIAREKYALSAKCKERKYYTNYMCARLPIPISVPSPIRGSAARQVSHPSDLTAARRRPSSQARIRQVHRDGNLSSTPVNRSRSSASCR